MGQLSMCEPPQSRQQPRFTPTTFPCNRLTRYLLVPNGQLPYFWNPLPSLARLRRHLAHQIRAYRVPTTSLIHLPTMTC